MARLVTLLALGAAALTAACGGSAQAQVMMPDATPLVVPAAPSHVVVPAAPEPPPVPVIETPSPQTNPLAASGSGATRTRTDPPPPVKPVAPPQQAATPQTQATPTPLPAAPNQGELEQQARALKDSADQTLDKIDYKGLSADGKAQWDTAKRFLKQADDALKAKNIVYAWQLANKAKTIATLLK